MINPGIPVDSYATQPAQYNYGEVALAASRGMEYGVHGGCGVYGVFGVRGVLCIWCVRGANGAWRAWYAWCMLAYCLVLF